MSLGQCASHFIGFILQTIPIAMLCLVPFKDEVLLFSRKKIAIYYCVSLTLFALGFTFMSWLLFRPDGSRDSVIRTSSDLYMMACILLWIVAFFLTTRCAVIKKIMVLMLLIHYAAVLYTISGIIAENTSTASFALMVYRTTDVLASAIFTLITFPLLYLFFKREILIVLDLMETAVLQRNCIYVGIAILLFCASLFALNAFGFYYSFSYGPVLIFLLSIVLTDAVLYYVLFSEIRLAEKNHQLEEQLRGFDEQYQKISSEIEEARRARHDIRHHLNHISILNSRGEQKELEKYLESYEATYRELEQMSLCGYPAFDNILQYYMEYASSQDIEIKTEVKPLKENLGFDIIDLTVLLGNLMENAIEACCRLPLSSKRYVRIWIKQVDVQLLIEIENSCETTGADQPNFTDGSNFTSTKHAALHGQGLKSISYVAEKYGGNAEFKKTEGIFTARVVLNIL